jgi:hypothetical protein
MASCDSTFEDNQDQPDISQSDKGMLPLELENVGQGLSINDADRDLADDASTNNLRR